MKIFEKYRAKALASEELAKEVRDYELRRAWAEIAIEWHALAVRREQEISQDHKVESAGIDQSPISLGRKFERRLGWDGRSPIQCI
jgi:hypothetical protein